MNKPEIIPRPARRLPPVVAIPLAVILGLALGLVTRAHWLSTSAIYAKLTGRGADCSWKRSLLYGPDTERLQSLGNEAVRQLRHAGSDETRGLELYQTASRPFWISREDSPGKSRVLLGYLLAEHQWMSSINTAEGVRPNDIVLDCGAHIGTFTSEAIRRGASKIIAIEPDPDNMYCLQRNFQSEIESGLVIPVQQGLWSSIDILEISLSTDNSGMHSLVQPGKGGVLRVPVTTIDRLVEDLGIPRVDFIKMDIEGAEREALQGGMQTIRRHHPRLMLEMYHRPDDGTVLPNLVRAAYPGYHSVCGPCEFQIFNLKRLVPHVVYFF